MPFFDRLPRLERQKPLEASEPVLGLHLVFNEEIRYIYTKFLSSHVPEVAPRFGQITNHAPPMV